ncbi:LOB domain-containing protein 41-like [Hibiscus syriacus]|uniref:LOB domain-containing protein 41-like n=1 Tax=Hibiscus syriacus TaxID=106335 RepID=A0A6A2XZB4_HIBSY|nr:uncharacterized protein LOC120186647 [Hibiscus syriacus]KAE8662187.1 LOB domain-containing protein 41-like [Hibiscus syriacus]
MFDFLFGWRKASKCKKLIKHVQCRLKLLKNKRLTMVKQLREDLAQLIKLGYEETAFNRAELLLKDENIMAVYDLLDHFCEFINLQLSYIRRHRDCPNDINEAVSSLMFASARCAELPELPVIRKLFGERYGHRFATAAVELLPGNLVNREIQEKLSVKSVSDDVKNRLIDEIVRDYCLQPGISALEYFPELERQVTSEMEVKSMQVEPLQLRSTSDCPDDPQCRDIVPVCSITSEQKDDETMKVTSLSDSLPPISGELVVYLDDIEELQSSVRKEAYRQDQRLFKFKSLPLPTRRVVMDGTDGDDESSDNENHDEKSKKLMWRSFSLIMKDTDHKIYYENHKRKSHHYRKLHSKKTVTKIKTPYALKRPKQPCHCQCSSALPSAGWSETRIVPYSRAVTMPQERPRGIHRYSIVRSNSLSVHKPNHVHPMLPEYEDIAAKFMALKKDRLQQKQR